MDSSCPSLEEIRGLAAQALRLDPQSVAFDDNLVERGLDSIRMIKLAARWRRTGADVTFADLALKPTVRSWYTLLAAGAASPRPDTAAQPRADDTEPFGLAVMQHGYWIGRGDDQALGGVAAHLYAEFDGHDIDPDRMERAVERLVRRHGMLRSQFLGDGTQRILDRPGLPVWELTDLRTADASLVGDRLAEIREHKTHQRMPAELGKVLDISLTLLPEGRTRLHVDVDMLAADALSYRIFLADLARFYQSDAEDSAPLAYAYQHYLSDYAALNAKAVERERSWWEERVPTLPDAPALPLVPESERADPLRTVRYEHWLDPEQKKRLIDRSHAHGVTPAMVLASVFAEIVGHWSSRQRFLLNLPLFNREPTHGDVEHMVGDFSSSVLLDVDLTASATLTERARSLQQSLHTSASHAAYPGLDVLRDLGRYRGEPVLASVVYTSGLNLGELFADEVLTTLGEPVWIISQGPQVVLDAQIVELRGGLLLNWDVRAEAFPDGMMDAMFAWHRDTIEALLADEASWDRPVIDALPAGQAEARRKANDTARPVSGRTLHEGFFAHAATAPEATAVLGSGQESLSYGVLRDRALRVAGALAAAGVGAGDTVSVQLPKGPDQIVAALGVLAAGAAYVPIGADQPDARRERIQDIGAVDFAVTAEPTTQSGPRSLALAEAERANPLDGPVPVQPEQIAYVLFTSGSTGEPKGVEVSHAAAMNTIDCLNERFGIGPQDRSLGLSALEFDLSVYDVFGLLSEGGSVIAVDDATRRDADATAALVRTHRPTVLNCVPSLLDMLLEAGTGPEGLSDGLRVVLLGGDWVGADLPGRLKALVPGARFAALGGTTETAIHSTVCEVEGPAPAHWRSVPYGVPLGNVVCRVVNERGLDCPDWVGGELWIGGRGVAHGYRGDPARTADRFVDHQGGRWYRTGDLARYLPDGSLEFLGRRDEQVKIRGYRIELGEVESALRSVDGVRQAIVERIDATVPSLAAVVSLDEPIGTEEQEEASGASAEWDSAIRAALAERLPPYMVPDRIDIVDAIPLTPNGKIDRRAVRRLLTGGATRKNVYRAPQNPLEGALAHILAEVLRLDRLGIDDDFFASGGDSVLATGAIARVREWLDTTEAAVSDLMAARTVEALATRLAERQSTPGRLEQVAEVYLDVAALTDDEVTDEVAN
ncbi:non-ribosomal peptide synthetase [Streptomyces sp. NBC_00690]|uniref:non-ribosomal peptide synthetase n=1 Tax=Streptomyces sp. NBC_00690 TaxID=2975808 RepID=UPI002E2DB0D3|nr:amino acid adenylation domain-containing protein [Streptomyces sp. NBC_00690]